MRIVECKRQNMAQRMRPRIWHGQRRRSTADEEIRGSMRSCHGTVYLRAHDMSASIVYLSNK